MKYLLTIYADESRWVDATERGGRRDDGRLRGVRPREAADVIVGGEGLQPTATATTVRVRDGERMLTDGPFAETREQLGGYYLVDVADLDAAISVGGEDPGRAARAPSRCVR